MLTIQQIYKIMAEDPDGGLWLPDFSDSETLKWNNGEFVPDTEEGYEYYLRWLVDYLTNKPIPINDYQHEILKHVQKDYLRHGAMMSCAALSSYWYVCHHECDFPDDFIKNPIPENAPPDAIDFAKNGFWYYGEHTERLPDYEQIQVLLVFLYHAKVQDRLNRNIPGTHWADIGWRPLLKSAVDLLKTKEDRIEYVKFFVNEFAYLQTK